MISEETRKSYERRFRRFIREISIVNRMKPKERYIYRIMDGVPFKDLETALMMAKIDFRTDTANENKRESP